MARPEIGDRRETVTMISMRRSTPTEWWVGWVERLIFLLPFVVGFGAVALVQYVPFPALDRLALFAAGVGALAIRLGIPVALWLDARAVDRSAVAWEPSRWLYALGALLVSAPLVALVYLYRRHDRIARTPKGRWWYYLIWVALVVGIAGIVAGIAAVVIALTLGEGAASVAVGAVALLAGTSAGIFPASIYRDALYVRERSTTWRPNPAVYLAAALVGLGTGVLQPVVAGYYLYQRRRL